MRLATVRTRQGTRAARLAGDELVLLPFDDVAAALAAGPVGALGGLDEGRIPAAGAGLAPVVRPGKIICAGVNYAGHFQKLGLDLPPHPTLFAKVPDALLGPHDDLVLPRWSAEMDWEAELAVVVGRRLRDVGRATARDGIAGYTVANDVTARDWQFRTTQWFQGKNFEASTPVGPVMVTPDEVDHAQDLTLTCTVDGQLMQQASTADLVFSPEELIAYVSEFVTLHPGDLVLTGTPDGYGASRDPKVFLRAGQTVVAGVAGVGELRNRVLAPTAGAGRRPGRSAVEVGG